MELPPREREVVRLTALGYTAKEASQILGRAVSTVDNQRWSAMRRLGIRRPAALVRWAIEHGVSPIGDDLSTEEKQRLANSRQGAADIA
jgi:DNA-binding NarL/FixJ family response regulator